MEQNPRRPRKGNSITRYQKHRRPRKGNSMHTMPLKMEETIIITHGTKSSKTTEG